MDEWLKLQNQIEYCRHVTHSLDEVTFITLWIKVCISSKSSTPSDQVLGRRPVHNTKVKKIKQTDKNKTNKPLSCWNNLNVIFANQYEAWQCQWDTPPPKKKKICFTTVWQKIFKMLHTKMGKKSHNSSFPLTFIKHNLIVYWTLATNQIIVSQTNSLLLVCDLTLADHIKYQIWQMQLLILVCAIPHLVPYPSTYPSGLSLGFSSGSIPSKYRRTCRLWSSVCWGHLNDLKSHIISANNIMSRIHNFIRGQSSYAVCTQKFLWRCKACEYFAVTLEYIYRSYHMLNFKIINLAMDHCTTKKTSLIYV